MITVPTEKLDRLVNRWDALEGELATPLAQPVFVKLSKE